MDIEDYKKMIKEPTLEQLVGDDLDYQSVIDRMIADKFREVAEANPDASEILYRLRENPETDSLCVDFYVVPKIKEVSISFRISADDESMPGITP